MKETQYSSAGKTGGLNRVQLTVNQMPEHTHNDNGHRHSIDLNTDSSGLHDHNILIHGYNKDNERVTEHSLTHRYEKASNEMCKFDFAYYR